MMKRLSVLLLAPTIACSAPSAPAPVAPSGVQAYAEAFCAANAVYLAAHTEMPTVTIEDIQQYFSTGPACRGVRYLGSVNDAGQERYVFVLTFDAGREDYLVFDFTGDRCTDFNRG